MGNNQCQNIEHSREDNVHINIFGLQRNRANTVIFNIFAVLLFGIPYLIESWYPSFKRVKYNIATLEECNFVLGNSAKNFNYSITFKF